jgi:hypothetical protein
VTVAHFATTTSGEKRPVEKDRVRRAGWFQIGADAWHIKLEGRFA